MLKPTAKVSIVFIICLFNGAVSSSDQSDIWYLIGECCVEGRGRGL